MGIRVSMGGIPGRVWPVQGLFTGRDPVPVEECGGGVLASPTASWMTHGGILTPPISGARFVLGNPGEPGRENISGRLAPGHPPKMGLDPPPAGPMGNRGPPYDSSPRLIWSSTLPMIEPPPGGIISTDGFIGGGLPKLKRRVPACGSTEDAPLAGEVGWYHKL